MVEHTRTLDFKIAFAIGLGTMIAAGIFSLSGTAVAEIGSSAVVAFVLAAVIAGITAAAYSEFASIYSENGGGYLFLSRTFAERRLLTYAIGASLFLGYTGTTAFYLATMDEWVFRFVLPESLHWLPHGTAGVVTAIFLGVLNARGTEESGSFQLIVTGAKVAVLFAFVAGAFAFRGPTYALGRFAGSFQVEPVNIVAIAALAFITFFGFSAIAASAGEIIEPRKTVPRAIAASMITVTVLYALVIVAMVNSPVPAEVIAQEGETAMGRVAASFLGSIGTSLIVAGAVFSMVSASNASILAASGIGSLMGRRGQAPRPFARIHRQYGTPFWSVAVATATIVTFIAGFIALFPAEGGLLGDIVGLHLGLTALTGFATFNLLVPLAVVNVALIYSRRRFPDLERGFRVPGVPVVPLLGVVANLALVYNLPVDGVVTGIVFTAVLLVAYVAWGGQPEIEELFQKVVEPGKPTGRLGERGPGRGGRRPVKPREAEPSTAEPEPAAGEPFRILVPVARPDRAPTSVRLAAALAATHDRETVVQVLNVTHVPNQTPWEMVTDTASGRVDRIRDQLAEADLQVDYTVEGHICQDIAFDILQTARDDEADLILMGYPEIHQGVTDAVVFKAPCDVFFASHSPPPEDLSVVTVGAGGGPHHRALLPIVGALAERGSEIHLVNVRTTGAGTTERVGATLDELPAIETAQVHSVSASSVAEGLVSAAADHGGVLVVGASRDRWLKQWVFGSTPDRVVDLAADADVPVLVYASRVGVPGRLAELGFPVLRYVRRHLFSGQASDSPGSTAVEARSTPGDGD